MNDPSAQPIDVAEQRAWLKEHKIVQDLSWKQLDGRTGVNHSTLSLFAGEKYAGDNGKIAEAIFRYRQTLLQQSALKVDTPDIPEYFETETSQHLIHLLGWAQRGRIVVGALSPGLGKSITAEHYKACNSSVFMFTATPSTASVSSMIGAVLRRLGVNVLSHKNSEATRQIMERVRDLGSPLLIVDEAQHLSDRAIDEIRSWHDATGLGIALLGNANLLQTLEGHGRSLSRAQLFSRISLRLVRVHPLLADVEALLDAWAISDDKVCDLVHVIAQKPGALRVVTFALELANMVAASNKEELQVQHLRDAWTQLTTRGVAA